MGKVVIRGFRSSGDQQNQWLRCRRDRCGRGGGKAPEEPGGSGSSGSLGDLVMVQLFYPAALLSQSCLNFQSKLTTISLRL
jgi:hypothetical protein